MSDEIATIPNCPICGDTTPVDKVCVNCQPYPEIERCRICERRGPRPVDADPPPPGQDEIAITPAYDGPPVVVTTQTFDPVGDRWTIVETAGSVVDPLAKSKDKLRGQS